MGINIIKARMTSSIFHDLSALPSSEIVKTFCALKDACDKIIFMVITKFTNSLELYGNNRKVSNISDLKQLNIK